MQLDGQLGLLHRCGAEPLAQERHHQEHHREHRHLAPQPGAGRSRLPEVRIREEHRRAEQRGDDPGAERHQQRIDRDDQNVQRGPAALLRTLEMDQVVTRSKSIAACVCRKGELTTLSLDDDDEDAVRGDRQRQQHNEHGGERRLRTSNRESAARTSTTIASTTRPVKQPPEKAALIRRTEASLSRVRRDGALGHGRKSGRFDQRTWHRIARNLNCQRRGGQARLPPPPVPPIFLEPRMQKQSHSDREAPE